MVEKAGIEKTEDYAPVVREKFPVRQIILFGSFAKGTQNIDSDIDIAIVLKKNPITFCKLKPNYSNSEEVSIFV
ncbi:MAG: hypothetical protein GF398_15125 [Chitinivibrionales bacterium]|nr:hypothetical protein [Chitinivibrionales bacterium]